MAEPPAAAAATADDETLAQTIHLTERLVGVYGFSEEAVREAINAVGPSDEAACLNYVLDSTGVDPGGPVTPIHNCPHAYRTDLPIPPLDAPCSQPGAKDDSDLCPGHENWWCLSCGVVRCSRYVHGHALQHFREHANHAVHMSLADLSVWCHSCGAYIVGDESLQKLRQQVEDVKFGNPKVKRHKSMECMEHDEADDAEDDGTGLAEEDAVEEEDEELEEEEDGGDDDASSDDHDSAQNLDDNDLGNTIEIHLDDIEDEGALRELIGAAAAQGIPIEYILSQLQQQAEQEADGPVDYPFDKLPTSLAEVAAFIQSDQCQKILILAGAGMSVASGIPDFRSADGLYATMNPDLLTASAHERLVMKMDPSRSLDQHLFLENPLPMLELQRAFILGTHRQQWKATLAHRFVELLHAKTGKLARLYTQNIDGLEDQCTQLPRDKVIAVHGSMDRAECARCESPGDFDDFCHKVQTQIKDLSGQDPNAPAESTAIECRICGSNTMKPSIVLFRSSLPKVFFDHVPKDVADVDLMIVMGTSLKVGPANSLVYRVPRSALRVLVNREPVGQALGMVWDEDEAERDYFAQGDCDAVLLALMEQLGWMEDLRPFATNHQLAETSATLLRQRLQELDEEE